MRNPAPRRLLCTILWGCLCWTPPAWSERVVTLASDPWPPYIEGRMGGYADDGIGVRIIRGVFSRIPDAEVRFPMMPWKRALRGAEQGNYDGINMLLKTAERERFLVYTDPLFVGRNLVWSLADTQGQAFAWEHIEDLLGKRIGIVTDYSYGNEFDDAISKGMLKTFAAPTVKHLFAMLANGRIDLVLANDAVGAALARQYDDITIRAADKATSHEIFYIGFSRKSPAVDLIPVINDILATLQAEGVIEASLQGR